VLNLPHAITFDLAPPSPKIDRHENREDENASAELISNVVGPFVVNGDWIEEGLDERIVRSVQDHAGPDAARLQTQPGPDKGQERQHNRQQRQIEPDRSIALVVGEEHDRTVPNGPARMLNDPASQPNSLHLDLLRLFEKPESVRLVTTNFDSHFVSGAATVFPAQGSCELHFAPALPLGHSFSGIVALHGSVSRPFERLVLTDSDFGRAYLTEGWARIFLQRLFETYTVLFVGYTFDR
jgi:SIR2-like domain